MKRYKVYIDISNIYRDLIKFKIREYSDPFLILFITANNPDDCLTQIVYTIINNILSKDDCIKTRIFCRLIKKNIRFDRIINL
jgi:hypothetical protein